jgi:hypothetical protein
VQALDHGDIGRVVVGEVHNLAGARPVLAAVSDQQVNAVGVRGSAAMEVCRGVAGQQGAGTGRQQRGGRTRSEVRHPLATDHYGPRVADEAALVDRIPELGATEHGQ